MKDSLTMEDPLTGKSMDMSRFLPLFEAHGIEPDDITGTEALGTEEGDLLVKFSAGERSVVIKITKDEIDCLFDPNPIQ